jgi:hypothetical protein
MLYNIGPREDDGEENVSSSMDVHPGIINASKA